MTSELEFVKTPEMFFSKTFDEIHEDAKANLDIAGLKESAYVDKIQKYKSGGYKIHLAKGKKLSCGIGHKLAFMLKTANPHSEIWLDIDLVNLEEDEELIFKSKNPLWVMKTMGNVISLKRIAY